MWVSTCTYNHMRHCQCTLFNMSIYTMWYFLNIEKDLNMHTYKVFNPEKNPDGIIQTYL